MNYEQILKDIGIHGQEMSKDQILVKKQLLY